MGREWMWKMNEILGTMSVFECVYLRWRNKEKRWFCVARTSRSAVRNTYTKKKTAAARKRIISEKSEIK